MSEEVKDPQALLKPSRLYLTPRAKRFVKLLHDLDETVAPEEWFSNGLELLKGKSYTVEQLIALRVQWCLATNTRFQNAALIKEVLDRKMGKVPLRVLTRPEETPEEFDALTDAEYEERKKLLLSELGKNDANEKNQPED